MGRSRLTIAVQETLMSPLATFLSGLINSSLFSSPLVTRKQATVETLTAVVVVSRSWWKKEKGVIIERVS